jgi:hypothetical protein
MDECRPMRGLEKAKSLIDARADEFGDVCRVL